MRVVCPVSVGELVDKITILQIKLARIIDETKQENVRRELVELEGALSKVDPEHYASLMKELHAVNEALWDAEDALRLKEKEGDFGSEFVELARSVYRHNDHRANLKRQINLASGSVLIEEKSYT